jgi:hypothetical protein
MCPCESTISMTIFRSPVSERSAHLFVNFTDMFTTRSISGRPALPNPEPSVRSGGERSPRLQRLRAARILMSASASGRSADCRSGDRSQRAITARVSSPAQRGRRALRPRRTPLESHRARLKWRARLGKASPRCATARCSSLAPADRRWRSGGPVARDGKDGRACGSQARRTRQSAARRGLRRCGRGGAPDPQLEPVCILQSSPFRVKATPRRPALKADWLARYRTKPSSFENKRPDDGKHFE